MIYNIFLELKNESLIEIKFYQWDQHIVLGYPGIFVI